MVEEIIRFKLYDTVILPSVYNLDINDQCEVVVRLIDYNGKRVSGEELTVTVSNGVFNNDNDTYTGVTDKNGEIILLYKPTDWGLHTFSCNDVNVQIQITGYKTISSTFSDDIRLRYNGGLCQFEIDGVQIENTGGVEKKIISNNACLLTDNQDLLPSDAVSVSLTKTEYYSEFPYEQMIIISDDGVVKARTKGKFTAYTGTVWSRRNLYKK